MRVNQMTSLTRYEADTHFATPVAAATFLSGLPAEGLTIVSYLHVKVDDQVGIDPGIDNPTTASFREEVNVRKKRGQKINYTWDRED